MPHSKSAPVPVAAMEAVMAQRMRQILDFGHTAEQDGRLPPCHLPKQARAYLEGAIDEILWARPGWINRAHLKLTKAGALLLASVDRLEQEKD